MTTPDENPITRTSPQRMTKGILIVVITLAVGGAIIIPYWQTMIHNPPAAETKKPGPPETETGTQTSINNIEVVVKPQAKGNANVSAGAAPSGPAGTTGAPSAGTTNATAGPPGKPLTILAGASVQGSPAFDPDTMTIKKGDKITVTNKDTLPHTVTSGTGPSDPNSAKQFDTSIIEAGATADIETTKLNPGQYPFHCTVHPYMTGKLVVQAGPSGPATGTTTSPPSTGTTNATAAPSTGTTNATAAPSTGTTNATAAPSAGTTNATAATSTGTTNATAATSTGTTNATAATSTGTTNATAATSTGTTNATAATSTGTTNATAATSTGTTNATAATSTGTTNATAGAVGKPLTILAGASVQGSPNFDPDTITVKKGDKITVTNKDTLPHTVTSGTGPTDPNNAKQFDTSIIEAGATADIETTKLNPGQYPFFCSVHPYMTGKLVVQ